MRGPGLLQLDGGQGGLGGGLPERLLLGRGIEGEHEKLPFLDGVLHGLVLANGG